MLIDNFYAGIGTTHQKGEAYSRIDGRSFWLIMCFTTPYLIMQENGEIVKGEAGDYIIQPPFVPLYHTGTDECETGFINDWILIDSNDFTDFINTLELPLNTSFKLPGNRFLKGYLKRIIDEDSTRNFGYKEKISAAVTDMLIDLKRALESGTDHSDRIFSNLQNVKRQIMNTCENPWTLETMAATANLSTSRFSAVYKKYYGISPINDLIAKRVEAAQRLLIATDLSIEEIAAECGFSSIHYFSNCFKKHTGSPPSEIRRLK